MHYNHNFPETQALFGKKLLKNAKLRFCPIDFPFISV